MRTRGHNLKINSQDSRINCKKHYFIKRVVPIWNGLEESVVNSESVSSYKSELDVHNLSRYCRGRAYTAN